MSKGFFQLLTCQQDIGQVHDLPRGVGQTHNSCWARGVRKNYHFKRVPKWRGLCLAKGLGQPKWQRCRLFEWL